MKNGVLSVKYRIGSWYFGESNLDGSIRWKLGLQFRVGLVLK